MTRVVGSSMTENRCKHVRGTQDKDMVGRRWWIARCGAVTRKGRPCLAMPVLDADGRPRNGRCKQHAGHSTGPKTPEGHQRCLEGRQKLYNQRKAAGLPAITRRPKAPQAKPPRRKPKPVDRRKLSDAWFRSLPQTLISGCNPGDRATIPTPSM